MGRTLRLSPGSEGTQPSQDATAGRLPHPTNRKSVSYGTLVSDPWPRRVFALKLLGVSLSQTYDLRAQPLLRPAAPRRQILRRQHRRTQPFGGAALSMAYSDVYLILIALLVNLRVLTQPATIAAQTKAFLNRTRGFGLRPPRAPTGALPAPSAFDP